MEDSEVIVRINVPRELKSEFELAIAKVVKQFVRRIRFEIAEGISSKSKLTEEQANALSDELKKRVAKRHAL